jgi:hypothetical protein
VWLLFLSYPVLFVFASNDSLGFDDIGVARESALSPLLNIFSQVAEIVLLLLLLLLMLLLFDWVIDDADTIVVTCCCCC